MTSVMDERARITELVSPNTAHSSLDYGLNVNCPPCRQERNAILGPRWFCHCACGWTKGPAKLCPCNGFTRSTSVSSAAGSADCAPAFLRGRPSHYKEDSKKASFRVIWSKHLEAEEHQAGIEALDNGKNIWAKELPLSPIAEDSIEPSWDSKDSSAAASTRTTTDSFIPVEAHPRMHWGLGFGLLLLSLALVLSLYTGIFYAWGFGFGLLFLGLALLLSLYQE